MRADEHQRMFRVETQHFWFRGTRRVIMGALEDMMGPRLAGARVLDIGCGTGFTLTQLPKGAQGVGLDFSATALELAARRATGASLVRGSAYELPFEDSSFDAVMALDVLEHLEDDALAAREMRRVLKPDGVAIVTVPAFRELWSAHDVALDHMRRYRLSEIVQVLRDAGFRIEHSSYYNFFLFPVVTAARLVDRLKTALGGSAHASGGGTDLQVPPAFVNETLTAILGSERHLATRVRLPVGVSCLVMARPMKP